MRRFAQGSDAKNGNKAQVGPVGIGDAMLPGFRKVQCTARPSTAPLQIRTMLNHVG